MTGIVAAVAGGTQNVIYASGLYNITTGVDLAPISFSASSLGGPISYNYTWIGYFRPATTGTATFTIASPYNEYLNGYGPYNWGGGGYSTTYLYVGQNAIAGSSPNLTVSDATNNYQPSLITGIYYPIRINWQSSLPYQSGFQFYDPYYATSSMTLSTSSGSLFYNTKTNGF